MNVRFPRSPASKLPVRFRPKCTGGAGQRRSFIGPGGVFKSTNPRLALDKFPHRKADSLRSPALHECGMSLSVAAHCSSNQRRPTQRGKHERSRASASRSAARPAMYVTPHVIPMSSVAIRSANPVNSACPGRWSLPKIVLHLEGWGPAPACEPPPHRVAGQKQVFGVDATWRPGSCPRSPRASPKSLRPPRLPDEEGGLSL